MKWWEKALCYVGLHKARPMSLDRYGKYQCQRCKKIGLMDSQGNLF